MNFYYILSICKCVLLIYDVKCKIAFEVNTTKNRGKQYSCNKIFIFVWQCYIACFPLYQCFCHWSSGCVSSVYQTFQVFWQDNVFVDLGSGVQVIYLTRNAESRFSSACRTRPAHDRRDTLPRYDGTSANFPLVLWNAFRKLQNYAGPSRNPALLICATALRSEDYRPFRSV